MLNLAGAFFFSRKKNLFYIHGFKLLGRKTHDLYIRQSKCEGLNIFLFLILFISLTEKEKIVVTAFM